MICDFGLVCPNIDSFDKICKEFIKRKKTLSDFYNICPCVFSLDIDECAENEQICEANAGSCVNTVGGYECRCQNGYQFDNSRRICVGKWLK